MYIKLKLSAKKTKYTIVVVKGYKSNKVVEKLGSFEIYGGNLIINPFRLVFWFSKRAGCSFNVLRLLFRFRVFG